MMNQRMRKGFLAGVIALGMSAAPVSAQFFPGNNPYFQPSGGVRAGVPANAMNPQPQANAVPQVAPLLPGGGQLVTNPYSNLLPGAGSAPISPFGLSPFMPYAIPEGGAYLMGAADIINAQGRFLIDRQDALIRREQFKQMKLDTRRKQLESWLWERENTPRPEQLRQEAMKEALDRSLNNPPMNEIASGTALNNILVALEGMNPGRKFSTPDIPLDEDTLKRINVTKGTGGANAGILANEGKLNWPRAIETLRPVEKTTDLRNKIQARTREAYDQAASGKVDPELVRELNSLTNELAAILTTNLNSMGFQDSTDAKKFMRNLEDSVSVLGRADARDFLEGGNVAKGKTVQDLVQNMTAKGLRFAPAVANNDAAYLSLHRSLVQYYQSLSTEILRAEK